MNMKCHTLRRGFLTVEEVEKAHEHLEIGDVVSFKNFYRWDAFDNPRMVKGTITGKYEHIFTLDNGRAYQYADYLLGGGEKHGRLHAM